VEKNWNKQTDCCTMANIKILRQRLKAIRGSQPKLSEMSACEEEQEYIQKSEHDEHKQEMYACVTPRCFCSFLFVLVYNTIRGGFFFLKSHSPQCFV